MYVDAEIAAEDGEKVMAVPDSAVIDTGTRKLVILDKGDGRFEPREVKTGRRGDGFVEIRERRRQGRQGRHRRQLPDRRRKQSEGGAATASASRRTDK